MDEKLAACLAEYTRLWEEVRKKWESQQQLTNQLVYLTAALAAVSWFILREGFEASNNTTGALDASSLEWARRAWLGIPFLLSSIGLLIAYHDRGIRQIAAYIYDWLRPEVERTIAALAQQGEGTDVHVWHWDMFWYTELGRRGVERRQEGKSSEAAANRARGPNKEDQKRSSKAAKATIAWLRFMDFWYSGAKYGLAFVPSVASLWFWWVQADDKGLWWIGFAFGAILTGATLLAGAIESLLYLDIRKVALAHEREGKV